MNKVIVMGRLGADPELKTMTSGNNVANFNVATSEKWKDKSGEWQEKTEWHKIVVWGNQAESCSKYLTKGRQALIEGKLSTRSWEDNDGNKKYATEIIASRVQFVGDNKESSSQSSFDSNDEIPF